MDHAQHRIYLAIFTGVPMLGLLVGIYMLATGQVTTGDWVSFGVMYFIAAIGVTIGYHRLLSHRAFTVNRWVRYGFAVAGAMAGQGPPLIWVAHHRRHHRTADKPGDPHSPYDVDHPEAPLTLKGFLSSHMMWLFKERLTSDPVRYCPDLARDRGIRVISNYFVTTVVGGVVLAGVIGFLVEGTAMSFFTGMLWGGLMRIFLGNQLTYAINSFGHVVGSRRFPTPDESRNNAWLAIPSFGEAWHNNHHAFPRSYRHGMMWYEIDLSAMLIWSMEKFGIARDVVRIDRAARLETRKKKWAEGGRADPWKAQLPRAALGPKMAEATATDVD